MLRYFCRFMWAWNRIAVLKGCTFVSALCPMSLSCHVFRNPRNVSGAFRNEVGSNYGKTCNLIDIVASKEQPFDASVRKSKNMCAGDTQIVQHGRGICGHTFVGKRIRATGAFALIAGVYRNNAVSVIHHRIDNAAKNAMLFSVPMKHKDGSARKEVLLAPRIYKARNGRSVRHRRIVPLDKGSGWLLVRPWAIYGRKGYGLHHYFFFCWLGCALKKSKRGGSSSIICV